MPGTCALDSAFYLEQGKHQEEQNPIDQALGTAGGLCYLQTECKPHSCELSLVH